MEEEIKSTREERIRDWLKIIMMVILIITMIVVGIIILKYAHIVKADPCAYCDCAIKILKGGIN